MSIMGTTPQIGFLIESNIQCYEMIRIFLIFWCSNSIALTKVEKITLEVFLEIGAEFKYPLLENIFELIAG